MYWHSLRQDLCFTSKYKNNTIKIEKIFIKITKYNINYESELKKWLWIEML